MVEHLFDSYPYPLTTVGVVGTGEWWATAITPRRSGTITGLRYYRPSTSDTPPSQLELYRFENHANPRVLLETVALVVPPGATGWIEATLTFPVDASPGETYFATATSSSAWSIAGGPSSGFGSLPWTLAQGLTDYFPCASVRWITVLGATQFRQNVYGLDLVYDAVPFGDFTVAELTDEFARWLTAGGDKYPESDLPAIKGQAEGANSNAQNAWLTAQDNQTKLADPDTGLAAIKNTLGDWIAGQWQAFQDGWDITRGEWGPIIQHTSDFLNGAADYANFAPLTAFAKVYDLWARLWEPGTPTDDPARWTLVDEADFTNNLLWPVAADLYRVTLSSFDPAGTSEPVGTETRHAYLGKWCPFDVQFSSEWHYFNTSSADLYLGGRMPGLGLVLYRPGTGHVQAWQRVEST